MPNIYKVKRGSDAGDTEGDVIFNCCVNSRGLAPDCGLCSTCSYPIGDRTCKLWACKDSKYCHVHLKKMYNVKFTTLNALKSYPNNTNCKLNTVGIRSNDAHNTMLFNFIKLFIKV